MVGPTAVTYQRMCLMGVREPCTLCPSGGANRSAQTGRSSSVKLFLRQPSTSTTTTSFGGAIPPGTPLAAGRRCASTSTIPATNQYGPGTRLQPLHLVLPPMLLLMPAPCASRCPILGRSAPCACGVQVCGALALSLATSRTNTLHAALPQRSLAENQSRRRLEIGRTLTIETVDLEGPCARGAGRNQGHRHLPHRLLHTVRRRPRGHLPGDPATKARASWSMSAPASPRCARGDHVIPLYTPECRHGKFCLSRKTNLCS